MQTGLGRMGVAERWALRNDGRCGTMGVAERWASRNHGRRGTMGVAEPWASRNHGRRRTWASPNMGVAECTVGAALRGRPCVELDTGAATEGRPYSTFCRAD